MTRSRPKHLLEREVQQVIAASDDLTSLAMHLRGPGEVPGIGAERGQRSARGIARYVSPHGSVRYVQYDRGAPIAALQVVTPDGRHAVIANVYVTPDRRRQGLASQLLARAQRDFVQVADAPDASLSAEGRAWRDRPSDIATSPRRSRRLR
jgi:ribosomal protein S18 acetylase RimI-like enzyme